MQSMIRAVVLVTVALVMTPQTGGTGTLSGRVTNAEDAGVALPGVTVTAISTMITRTATSAADGRYTIRELPPGTYRVRADMNAFRAAAVERVEIKAGASTEVDFSMRLGIITNADFAAPPGGVADALREADEVLHVRARSIIGSGPLGRNATIVGTQYEAVVLETIKPGGAVRAPNSFVKFWQHDAGRVVEDGRNYLGQFRVIAPGESVIVMLRSEPARGLTTYADARYLISTAKGVVTAFGTPDPRIPNGTPVDKAIETLRALLKSGGR
jgi:hypothetical protein